MKRSTEKLVLTLSAITSVMWLLEWWKGHQEKKALVGFDPVHHYGPGSAGALTDIVSDLSKLYTCTQSGHTVDCYTKGTRMLRILLDAEDLIVAQAFADGVWLVVDPIVKAHLA